MPLARIHPRPHRPARKYIAELLELVVDTELRVSTTGHYSLTEAAQAHRALEQRQTTGKVVLTI